MDATSRLYLPRYLTNWACRSRDASLQPHYTHRYSGAPTQLSGTGKEDSKEAVTGERARMPSPRRAVLLVAAVFLWWSAAGALAADGGNGTACLCTGPQCVPPCPAPGTPTTTSPTQFPFCPQRPPAVGPFPWEQPPSATPRSQFPFPQDAGFLAAAAAASPASTAAWLAVAAACSALLLLLLQQ